MALKNESEVVKKLQATGSGSVSVIIPIPWLDQLGITSVSGTQVVLKKKKNGILIEKVRE